MRIPVAITMMSVGILLCACGAEHNSTQTARTPIVDRVMDDAVTFISDGIIYTGATNEEHGVDHFLGVPYAKAPVAELRWMPPQQFKSNKNFINAQEFAPACMQGPHLANWYKGVITTFGGDPTTFPLPSVSEDCLYLNIWRPHVTPQDGPVEALPVFVFIHGGSNKSGWSYEPNYMGESLAQRGVVVVTIAYRVGAFGFFAHPQLQQSNFGLLDQIAALQWVQKHIASVGGDPDQVTVGGESAGANNIDYLLSSPLAKGLFQRVIHQSGGSPMLDRTLREEHVERGRQLVAKVLGDQAAADLNQARKVPAEHILAAAEEVYQDHYFDPVIDNVSVTMSVKEAADTGVVAGVDLLIGTNASEWLMYLDAEETIDRWMHSNLPSVNADLIKAALDPNESPTQQLDRLITAYNFVCPSLKLAAAVAARGGKSWVYYFARQRDGDRAASMGAYHGAELPYVFDTHDDWLPTSDVDDDLTDTMMNYWVQFMYSGNPNSEAHPDWPGYRKPGDAVQILDSNIRSGLHSSEKLCLLILP